MTFELNRRSFSLAGLAAALGLATPVSAAEDPLPSWNDGPAKRALQAFVRRVTTQGPDFVAPAERIATFDNDGTLWAEMPVYFEVLFAVDRGRELAAKDPALAAREPFKSLVEKGAAGLAGLTQAQVVELVAVTHSGMTTEQFQQIARAWFATARHPTTKRLYTQMVYQPQLELLAWLRREGFKTFIVSGGGVDFMRAFAEPVYGVPPEQVIGSSVETRWEMREGVPVLVKLPKVSSVDDKDGKPINIDLQIGRRPILAFGNSDGDLEMLQWTQAGPGARLMLLVHHDDAVREWAYDRDSKIGRLDKAWDAAVKNGWTVVSMRREWKQIFPPE
ncbi:HAD family hydrolase [Caulobacter sp. 17J80-11]|uniref:HAD family hydrolase n=1 Tax=Caulobacter sp. 17J80-11 TaxID=2763502 RepID=UPI0016538727|nr:haloacid dehalogenase-like hydrolase [Caulobacter sp. 17J80-11]